MKLICLGNYPPRKCGIATFTENLVNAITESVEYQQQNFSIEVVAMNDDNMKYDYPPIVTKSINCSNKTEYIELANYINNSNTDAFLLQHEYGIFGGESGLFLIELLKRLKIPVVTTLHTVLKKPSFHQKEVLIKIAEYSNRVIVMNPIAVGMLTEIFGISVNKIQVIEHGVPDFSKLIIKSDILPSNWKGKKIILTFGLIGRSKGIETVLKAMRKIVVAHPETLYVILGKTHPHIVAHAGEEYRDFLHNLTKDFGIQDNIMFIDEYVSEDVLMQYLKRTDIYITPYLNEAQITSGTLAYALSGGSAIVSTPYWHAQTLLTNDRGRLFNFLDDKELSEIVIDLLDNPLKMIFMRRNAYNYGTHITWPKIGLAYYQVFDKILNTDSLEVPADIFSNFNITVPKFDVAHIQTLTDCTGIIQHATGSVPKFSTGYCVDDNSRALILSVLAYNRNKKPKYLKLIYGYLRFILHMQNEVGTFNNYMSYDKKIDIDSKSDDTFGRAIWALGFVIRYAPNDSLLQTSCEIFNKAIVNIDKLVDARGYANCILGLYHYIKRYPDRDNFIEMLVKLSNKLCDNVKKNSHDDWVWFESELTYDNGLLPAALYLAYEITDNQLYYDVAEKTRAFLEKHNFSKDYLTVIGNRTWLKHNSPTDEFDQQPVDAMAMVIMYSSAFKVNASQDIIDKLKLSFMWYFGKNEINLPLYDSETQGCNDGINSLSINRNQGAESTISYLLSWLIATPFFENAN